MHSSRDACCTLTGETKHRADKACDQWTDGKIDGAVTGTEKGGA